MQKTSIVPAEKPAFYYDQVYTNGYVTDHMQPVYNAVLSILESLKPPVQILEIGCGIGLFGEMAVDAGLRYRGFDFSIEAIRRCPNKIRTKIARRNAYHCSTFRLGYNVVVAIEVMEHLQDLEVVDMIRPGTVCVFTLPNYTDEAHLRTYKDERFVRQYYKGLIRWHKIDPIVMAPDQGIECGKKIIWVCKGVKV
jgi:2-polyprenyl-3-methyl-5-hydroxy-6-metoxy-1,4-benzoquinol methylase